MVDGFKSEHSYIIKTWSLTLEYDQILINVRIFLCMQTQFIWKRANVFNKWTWATVKWASFTLFQIHTDFNSNLAQDDVTEQHKHSKVREQSRKKERCLSLCKD